MFENAPKTNTWHKRWDFKKQPDQKLLTTQFNMGHKI